MRQRLLIWVTLCGTVIILLCASVGVGLSQTPSPECAKAMDRIRSLRAPTSRIELLSIPSEVMYTHALSPAELKTEYYDKVVVSARDKLFFGAIFDALDGVRVYDSLTHPPDARLGLILKGVTGGSIGTVYLDSFGIHALIDDRGAGPLSRRVCDWTSGRLGHAAFVLHG
jgi:hypothetical protein